MLYVCSNMKFYYFRTYSGYNMLSGGRTASENAKKLTWMHIKVTMYNILEWRKKISYIYKTFCRLSYFNYDILYIIVLDIWYFMQIRVYIIIFFF